MTSHFSIVCSNHASKNLFIYPEVAFKCIIEGDDEDIESDYRIDLMVYNDLNKSMLLVESKRLFSNEKARSIIQDIDKIIEFKPVQECNVDMPICMSNDKAGLILAVTQSLDVKDWWMTKNNSDCLDKYKSSGWMDLKNKLYKDNKYQQYVMDIGFQSVESHFENWDELFILYVLFDADKSTC